ncbi:MAG: multicopper oxidase domain-containing protein, partial [Casimicrobiaceae bacterium]
MSPEQISAVSRRDFLQLGVTIAAGVVVPPVLSACGGGGGDDKPIGPKETFVEPLDIQSVNGRLDVTIIIAYVTMPFQGTIVTLRNMYGTIPAPTLRMNVGDLLRIKIVNKLPPNPPNADPTKHLRYHNSTNLHTHGLHVYPDIYPQPAVPPYTSPNTTTPPLTYGDFVVDDPEQGIKPGEERQYEYRIREDHPAGTYWYHPHLHGSSAMQVGSGMAGALIIEGPIDAVPEIAAAAEKTFVFQAPIYDLVTGQLEDFSQVGDITTKEPNYVINGVRVPRIVMRSGEVQNWRFINAAIFKSLNLTLDKHTLYQYSHDGNPRRTFKPSGPVLPVDPGSGLPQGIVLAAANRSNVLVKAGAPGTYQLKTLKVEVGRPPATVAEDVLAEIVVLDDFYPMNLPPEPLPVTPFLNPITDEELAAHGGLKRTIVMRVIASNPPPAPGQLPFTGAAATSLVQPPPGELPDWVFQTGDTQIANKVYALGSAATVSSTNPGLPTTYIPFQSSKALTQTVALNAVEEWTIVNMNNIRHPFHIHVNPMYVVAINGVRLAEPYWADTVPLPFSDVNPTPPGTNPNVPGVTQTSFTFRMRFLHYTGRYVMHCHMLVHEDMGMMQG